MFTSSSISLERLFLAKEPRQIQFPKWFSLWISPKCARSRPQKPMLRYSISYGQTHTHEILQIWKSWQLFAFPPLRLKICWNTLIWQATEMRTFEWKHRNISSIFIDFTSDECSLILLFYAPHNGCVLPPKSRSDLLRMLLPQFRAINS